MKLLKNTLLVVALFSVVLTTQANIAISPLKHEITIENGESGSKVIKVTNNQSTSITLYTSTEDFIAGDDSGSPTFVKPEDQAYPELSLANWIEIEDKNITLSPGETREVSFNVNVPENGEPGGHYGAIFFSPGVPSWAQVAVVQRIWVLILIDVPGEVIIDWKLNSFQIGQGEEAFEEKQSFNSFPIKFETVFQNLWNIHIKPKWKVELIDEDGNVLEKVGKEAIVSPAWAFVWEKMVNYIPINDGSWNVLPNSNRKFSSTWEWFGYNVLQDDWTKIVKFKNLTDYYAEKAAENQAYLMFWEQVHTRTVNKKITANFTLSYEGKDLEKKDFNESKDFYVTYDEKFIWINYYVVGWAWTFVLLIIIYLAVIAPKSRAVREEEMKKRIMEEMAKIKEEK